METPDRALILNLARDLTIKALDFMAKERDVSSKFFEDVGEHFKQITLKVNEAYKSIGN